MSSSGIININELPIADLEKLVTEYPWFAYARRVLLHKMAAGGREHLEVYLKKCSAYVPSLRDVYCKVVEVEPEDELTVIDFEEINRDITDIKSQESPKYIILGGDYFTKEDLASLGEEQSFSIGKLGSLDNSQESDIEPVVKSEGVEELDGFYTETLAAIYAEQGYYEEAMKVYSKLILLYPEKSAYFATLVSKVKSKNN